MMQEQSVSVSTEAAAGPGRQPLVIPPSEHGISRRDIDPTALKVLWRLSRSGYTAYLVGGGVRDLLLKRKPKDFDISTDARPDQIKSLFRNCLLIGRRFRLAHLRFGDKIIETSTFRCTPEISADPNDPEADLFQRDDNQFGSPEEDALRRDFTINGLFYDIKTFSVIDYVGGIGDLKKRLIRSIGDPCIRFREDPVRMIRAVRFASRLGFDISPDDLDAIRKHREEILKASPARLLEEIGRLFAFAAGERSVRLLESTGLLEILMPEVAEFLSNADDASLFWRRLAALDAGDTVLPDATQGIIFAVLFTDPIAALLNSPESEGREFRRRFERMRHFLDDAAERLTIPRKLREKLFRLLGSQSRFANPGRKRAIDTMVKQDWFTESLALAEIDAAANSRPLAELNPWRDMYADVLCARDDSRSKGGGHNKPQRSGGSSGNGATPDADAAETPSSSSSSSQPGQGLSRSARRRRNRQRNKEKRRHDQQQTTVGQNSPAAVPAAAKTSASAVTQTPPTPESTGEQAAPKRQPEGKSAPAPAADAKSGKRPARKRSAKTEAAAEESVEKTVKAPAKRQTRSTKKTKETAAENDNGKGKADATTPAEAPIGPLTAASFYTKPAAKPKATKSAKSSSTKTKNDKAGAPAAAPAKSAGKLHALDRSEEADLPMHWLDEI